VVTIYLDPDAEGVTSAHLKAFERGKYGPIFAPQQSQQAPLYTHAPTTTPTNYSTQIAVLRDFSHPMSTTPSGYPASGGYPAPGGYAVPAGYQVPSGYASPSGHTAPSRQATIQASTNIYDEEDEEDEEDDEPEEKKD
jgi:hypothetical protein